MLINDVPYFDGMHAALAAGNHGYRSKVYNLVHEIYCIRNMSKSNIPVRQFDRLQIVKDFKKAVRKAGSVKSLLEEMLKPVAAKAETSQAFWVHDGPDTSRSYCSKCVELMVKRARKHGYPSATVDGGWGVEVDCPEYCSACSMYLDETILQGPEELQYYRDHGLDDDPVDCSIVLNCLNGCDDERRHTRLIRTIAVWFFARYPQYRPVSSKTRQVAQTSS